MQVPVGHLPRMSRRTEGPPAKERFAEEVERTQETVPIEKSNMNYYSSDTREKIFKTQKEPPRREERVSLPR